MTADGLTEKITAALRSVYWSVYRNNLPPWVVTQLVDAVVPLVAAAVREAAEAERQQVAEWLRSSDPGTIGATHLLAVLADDIQRGEHLAPPCGSDRRGTPREEGQQQ